jgi:hypothetical protein
MVRFPSSRTLVAISTAQSITRLLGQWKDDYETFGHRNLSKTEYVYVWVGIPA